MQLTKNIFQNSAMFIEKKWVEIDCGEKVDFCGEKELIHVCSGRSQAEHVLRPGWTLLEEQGKAL